MWMFTKTYAHSLTHTHTHTHTHILSVADRIEEWVGQGLEKVQVANDLLRTSNNLKKGR